MGIEHVLLKKTADRKPFDCIVSKELSTRFELVTERLKEALLPLSQEAENHACATQKAIEEVDRTKQAKDAAKRNAESTAGNAAASSGSAAPPDTNGDEASADPDDDMSDVLEGE